MKAKINNVIDQLTHEHIARMLDFYRALALHNDREWFEQHRSEYLAARDIYRTLASQLLSSLSAIDPDLKGLGVNDCTYRIFRDIRFSKDKLPYKTWAGIFIAKGTKKGPHIGYYLHLEPATGNFFICQGTYWHDKAVLSTIREDIMLRGDEFTAALSKAEGFQLDRTGALKKVPAGFPADSPYSDYFKIKVFAIIKRLTEDYILAPSLVERLTQDFAKTTDFSHFINRAVDYATQERADETVDLFGF